MALARSNRLRRQQMNQREQPPLDTWSVSFSDLLTLLLSFFIMRLAMTTDPHLTLSELLENKDKKEVTRAEIVSERTAALRNEIIAAISAEPIEALAVADNLEIEAKDDGTLLALKGGSFLPGSDVLSKETEKLIVLLATILREKPLDIMIAGHTDSVPISNLLFPSNWELSGARAIAVAQLLMKHGIPGTELSAVGYADTKPRADNSTAEGKERNRRVEVMLRYRDLAGKPQEMRDQAAREDSLSPAAPAPSSVSPTSASVTLSSENGATSSAVEPMER